MKWKLTTLFVAMVLVGCGGSSGSSGTGSNSDFAPASNAGGNSSTISSPSQAQEGLPAEAELRNTDIRFLARIKSSMYYSGGAHRVGLSADFIRYESAITASNLIELRTEPLGCVVNKQTSEDVEQANALSSSKYPESKRVSPGQVITATTPMGTLPELTPSSTFPWYVADWDAKYPSGTALHIPGDEFPVMKKIALPELQPLTGLEVFNAGEKLHTAPPTPAMSAIWHKGSSPDSRIRVYLFSGISESGASNYDRNEVICITEDDGEFQFPADVIGQMEARYSGYEITRITNQFEIRGDVLVQTHSEVQPDW